MATGDILRQEVADGTDLGREAKRYMDDGALVPDEVVIGMIRSRLAGGADDFLLDGFPRTVAQAEALDVMLDELGAPVEAVISLMVPDEELTRRLGGRWLCRRCGRSFHEVSNPYDAADLCPVDGAVCDLYQRADDRPETIEARLQTYAKQTAPVVDYYRRRAVLREIDGTGDLGEIYDRIRAAIDR